MIHFGNSAKIDLAGDPGFCIFAISVFCATLPPCLSCGAQEPKGNTVLSSLRQRYLHCERYEDSGVVDIFRNGDMQTPVLHVKFDTMFVKGEIFRFHWRDAIHHQIEVKNHSVVVSLGGSKKRYHVDALQQLLKLSTNRSLGCSEIVPALLFPELLPRSALLRTEEWEMEAGSLDNGLPCHVLKNVDEHSSVSIYVGKENELISKVVLQIRSPVLTERSVFVYEDVSITEKSKVPGKEKRKMPVED